ncbi:MAG: DUF2007 domain-containing protein [bacterium]
MKELLSFSTRAEAEMFCSVLENNGISCLVKADDCGGMRPALAFSTGGYMIYVEENDYTNAYALIGPEKKTKKKK